MNYILLGILLLFNQCTAITFLQGHDDENWPRMLAAPNGSATPGLHARYANLAKLSPGIRRYNVWWNMFEPNAPPDQTAPNCSEGFTLIPSNDAEKQAFGFHQYHCYQNKQLTYFNTIFDLDSSINATSAAIIYGTPDWARFAKCTGFKFGPDSLKAGCLPRPDTMNDFEDYITMLTYKYSLSSSTSSGNLKHFVVWNEVASLGWMDPSPVLPNRASLLGENPLSTAQMGQLVDMYIDLLNRTSLATSRLKANSKIWVSIDRLMQRPHQGPLSVLHVGNLNFLNILWSKLACNSFEWSLAVHPYDRCDPTDSSEWPAAFTFATLPLLRDWTRAQVEKFCHMNATNPNDPGYPFTLQFASEQGWNLPDCLNEDVQARNICWAQNISETNKELIAVTHNFFQDNPGGSEQGGKDYGLIPGNVSSDLSDGPGHPTFDAYVSTGGNVWGQSDQHFCCAHYRVGCKN